MAFRTPFALPPLSVFYLLFHVAGLGLLSLMSDYLLYAWEDERGSGGLRLRNGYALLLSSAAYVLKKKTINYEESCHHKKWTKDALGNSQTLSLIKLYLYTYVDIISILYGRLCTSFNHHFQHLHHSQAFKRHIDVYTCAPKMSIIILSFVFPRNKIVH